MRVSTEEGIDNARFINFIIVEKICTDLARGRRGAQDPRTLADKGSAGQ
jgi:hypothetical protein